MPKGVDFGQFVVSGGAVVDKLLLQQQQGEERGVANCLLSNNIEREERERERERERKREREREGIFSTFKREEMRQIKVWARQGFSHLSSPIRLMCALYYVIHRNFVVCCIKNMSFYLYLSSNHTRQSGRVENKTHTAYMLSYTLQGRSQKIASTELFLVWTIGWTLEFGDTTLYV